MIPLGVDGIGIRTMDCLRLTTKSSEEWGWGGCRWGADEGVCGMFHVKHLFALRGGDARDSQPLVPYLT